MSLNKDQQHENLQADGIAFATLKKTPSDCIWKAKSLAPATAV